MPATRSRVLLVFAIAGAVAAVAVFGYGLHVAGVNASAVQRADLAGVPRWSLRARSLDPICDWIAVVAIAIAIGAAAMLLAGKRTPRLPGERRRTIDPLWKFGAWSIVGHALLVLAFSPLAEADGVYTGSYEVIDDAPPDFRDDDSAGTAVLVSIQRAAWRGPPVEPVEVGVPTAIGSQQSSVRRTIKHELASLAACYTHPRTGGSGTIVATFTIGPTGAVTSARADGFDPAVAACVARLVRASEFAPPNDGASSDVVLPINYRGGY